MRPTYDPKHNVAYIRLRERAEQVETVALSAELNIDIARTERSTGSNR